MLYAAVVCAGSVYTMLYAAVVCAGCTRCCTPLWCVQAVHDVVRRCGVCRLRVHDVVRRCGVCRLYMMLYAAVVCAGCT